MVRGPECRRAYAPKDNHTLLMIVNKSHSVNGASRLTFTGMLDTNLGIDFYYCGAFKYTTSPFVLVTVFAWSHQQKRFGARQGFEIYQEKSRKALRAVPYEFAPPP